LVDKLIYKAYFC